jgi:TM2 domain-containing membrane protein YozV
METSPSSAAEWFYVGHYGQLGPLTHEQMTELIQDGVIERETYIWKSGMPNWAAAESSPDLRTAFSSNQVFLSPPPPPTTPAIRPQPPTLAPAVSMMGMWNYTDNSLPKSDRSRVLAGVLQLIIPGTGRMYLGYAAQGVLQLFLTPFGCGVGWLWSVIDGLIILTGGVKLDGYGRRLND